MLRLLAPLFAVLGALFMTAEDASAETRSLKLHFVHTGEKAEIVFKRNGRYDAGGLRQISQILRDWRRNEPTKMDPRLLDLVWEAYRQTGSNEYITVVSGYRSPATNAMLRGRSRKTGVAKKSQHMLGKAMDFYIPGVKLKTLREIGLKMQGGGVGYYPTSGSPFVHFDVGNVRHWPKMKRSELIALFPNGKTLHVPSDGKPLPGFEQALASYKNRQSAGALAIASASSGGSGRKSRGLLAALFGGGDEGEADADDADSTSARATSPRMPVTPRRAPAKPVAEPAPMAAEPEAEPVPARAPAPAPAPREDAQQPAVVAAAPTPERLPFQVLSPEEANRAPVPMQEATPSPETPESVLAALSPRSIPLPAFAARETPETTQAAEMTALLATGQTAEESGFAGGAPLPSWRPDEPVAENATVLTALAESEQTKRKIADILAAPMPATRPADMARPAPRLAALAPDETAQHESAQAAAVFEPKSTAKSYRLSRKDARPEPRAKTVALAAASARWALNGDATATASQRRVAFNAVNARKSPASVYLAGFTQDRAVQADANRFSGKAVNFLPAARFE
ncbi:MAG: DUF882 domain-containing protein [Methylobacterium mesophilicum]|nr:DUF882 domain-containing protein [Methylobacterium mesophilicum]